VRSVTSQGEKNHGRGEQRRGRSGYRKEKREKHKRKAIPSWFSGEGGVMKRSKKKDSGWLGREGFRPGEGWGEKNGRKDNSSKLGR